MESVSQTKFSAKELNSRIQKYVTELAQATDKARSSNEMHRYLDYCSKFHDYSPRNIWLIMHFRPEATFVAGFYRWISLNRFVRKGEQGIPILAPIIVKEDDKDGIETKQLVGFKVVYVFDVTQTYGEPLPPPPEWKSPEKNKMLNSQLMQFAKNRGIEVSFRNLPGETQGLSRGGAIELSPTAGTIVLVHEISHELMHKGKDNRQTKEIKELQAEAVAYVVCRHFGLENLNSPNYLALFNLKSDEIYANMERIRDTAHKIITATDRHIFNNCLH